MSAIFCFCMFCLCLYVYVCQHMCKYTNQMADAIQLIVLPCFAECSTSAMHVKQPFVHSKLRLDRSCSCLSDVNF